MSGHHIPPESRPWNLSTDPLGLKALCIKYDVTLADVVDLLGGPPPDIGKLSEVMSGRRRHRRGLAGIIEALEKAGATQEELALAKVSPVSSRAAYIHIPLAER